MPTEPGARCALQVARERRLRGHPDEFGMEQDICDVTLWIQEKFRLSSVHVWVDRHCGHQGREISGVTVLMSPTHPDPMTPAAHEAFLALGYDIEDTGAGIYAHSLCDGNHSKHEILQAYARIESALRSFRSR